MGIEHYEDETVMDDRDDINGAADHDDVDEFAETVVLDIDDDLDDDNDEDVSDADAYRTDGPVDDFVGDSSVVFDVDDLLAELEAEPSDTGSTSSRLRRRLEAIAERKRRHDDLMDFADYDLDI